MSTANSLDPTIRSHLVTRRRRSVEDTSPLRSEELDEVQQDVGERVRSYLDFLRRVGNRDLQQAIARHRATIVNGVQEGIVESTRRPTRAGEPPRRTRGMDIAKAALGQRPSFLVIDNEICLEGSLAHPSGWENLLAQPEVRTALKPRLAAVGMIMDEGTKALGTGFVIAPNLVMTNRHIVEQMFDLKSSSYPPPFLKNKSRWYVNFSKEFGGSLETVCEAEVRGLGFVSPEEIQKPDPQSPALFAQADVAVLEIELSDNAPLPILELNWGRPMPSDEVIVVVGHPCYDERYKTAYNHAAPMNRIAFEEVFGGQFQCKHAAPGYAREFPVPTLPQGESPGRRFQLTTNLMHDASTLGGNSGSPVISPSGRYETVGLHFWGEAAVSGNQITNLAHPFAAIADCPNPAFFEANGNGLRMWLSTRKLTENTGERRSRSRRSLSGSHGRGRQADVQRARGRGRRAGAKTRGNRNR